MKDLPSRFNCDPSNFVKDIKYVNDSSHFKGEYTLSSVVNLTSFQNAITNKLPQNESTYVIKLIGMLDSIYPNISALRKALANNSTTLDPNDPDTPFDTEILKKIYLNIHNSIK